jgi:AraC-like DNA-binding protein
MKECILIIENTPVIKDLLINMSGAYRQLHAKDREQAAMILANEPVSLIISTCGTDLFDGSEFCQFVKSTVQYCHIAYVLVDTADGGQDLISALKVGADAVLSLPVSAEAMCLQVGNLLKYRSNMVAYHASLPFEDSRVVALSQSDEAFIRKIERYIYDNMTRSNIDIGMLSHHMNISRATFYRKLKTLTSLSPKNLVDITRLKEAKRLILQNEHKLFEIGKMVGYNCQESFTRSFYRHFNATPTDFANTVAQKKRKQFSNAVFELQIAS